MQMGYASAKWNLIALHQHRTDKIAANALRYLQVEIGEWMKCSALDVLICSSRSISDELQRLAGAYFA